MAAGYEHSLLLRRNGSVCASGDYYLPGPFVWGTPIIVPPGLSGVVAVASGTAHSLALKADGTVLVWGTNTHGQLDMPADLTNVVAISAGTHSSLALKGNGTVVGWGYNFYAFKGEPLVPANLTNVVAVASGGGHTFALVGNGPPFLTLPPRSRRVLGTSTHYFYVQATGAWPLSYQWQLNDTNLAGANGPVLTVSNVQSDQAGRYTVIVSNAFGTTKTSAELQVSSVGITLQPQDLAAYAGGTAEVSVSALGFDLGYQWRKDGVAITGATNSSLHFVNVQLDQSGVYTVVVSSRSETAVSEPAVLSIRPVLITAPPTNQVAFWHGSATLAVAALSSGPIQYQWRFNGVDLPSATNDSLSLSALEKTNSGRYDVRVSSSCGSVISKAAWLSVIPVAAWGDLDQSMVPASLAAVKAIAAGMFYELALTSDGAVVVWGDNGQGQIDVPAGLTNVIAIASGSSASQSQALSENRTLTVWGTRIYPPAEPPAGLSNVVGMSSGQVHALAVRSDGSVSAWGSGSIGENETPSGLSNVVAVAAGEAHNIALRADGTVAGWGAGTFVAEPRDYYNFGQAQVPVGLSNVVVISAGANHSAALRGDGTVVAWGDNGAGQTSVPPEATNGVAIAAGEFHTLALRADGTVIAWGSNFNGQSLPPPELSNVVAIAAGGRHSLALIGDGPPVMQVSVEAHWTPDGLVVGVPTRSGRVYALECTESLERVDWKLLPRVAGDGSVRLLKDPSASGSQRFYRVRAW